MSQEQDLLNQCQDLRSSLINGLPSGQPLADALRSLDNVMANVRLVAIDDEKAAANALVVAAGKDPATLKPVEMQAWVSLARAQKAADIETAAEVAQATADAKAVADKAAADAAVLAQAEADKKK